MTTKVAPAAFLLTDIEGSSVRWLNQREAMQESVASHDRILREAIARHGGSVFKTAGDAFFAVFDHAAEAVLAAIDGQRLLAGEDWSRVGGLKVRMAVHFGTAEERGGDYYGPAVNRCARLLSLAHGGQVLASSSAAELVISEREVVEQLRLLGSCPLDDPEQSVAIYQVMITGLPQVFPPLRTAVRMAAQGLATIAVLPFANRSGDGEGDYFSEGLADELLTLLGKTAGLRVAARTSSFQFRGNTEDLASIGAKLNVATVLEGSVRKAGSRVRISVQLVNVSDGLHMWAEKYDRTLDDIFAVQDEIAESVVKGLRATLIGAEEPEREPDKAPVERDTSDTAAYTDFLHGRHLLYQRRGENETREAIGFFESALRRDPRFERARVGLASCHSYLAFAGFAPYEESLSISKELLKQALAVDDQLVEAHFELSFVHLADDNLEDARYEAERALALNPNLSEPYRTLAQLDAGKGDIDSCIRLLEAAQLLDPLNLNILSFLNRAYFWAGRAAEGLELSERTRVLVPYRAWCHLAEHYLGAGELDGAAESVRQLEALRPNDPYTMIFRGFLAAASGELETSRGIIEELKAIEARGPVITWMRGFLHFGVGETDEFFVCMRRAKELHTLPFIELMYSPLCAQARSDPRMSELLDL